MSVCCVQLKENMNANHLTPYLIENRKEEKKHIKCQKWEIWISTPASSLHS